MKKLNEYTKIERFKWTLKRIGKTYHWDFIVPVGSECRLLPLEYLTYFTGCQISPFWKRKVKAFLGYERFNKEDFIKTAGVIIKNTSFQQWRGYGDVDLGHGDYQMFVLKKKNTIKN